MGGRISHSGDKYNDLLFRVVRYAALLAPLLIALYWALIELDYVPHSVIYNQVATALLVVAVVALGVVQFAQNRNSIRRSYFFLTAYHLLSALLILFVSGFLAPLTLLWFMLSTITELYFGRKGAFYSLALLFSVAMLDISLQKPSLSLVLLYGTYLTITVSAYMFTNRLRAVHDVEHIDLLESKEKQYVQQNQLTALVNNINETIISTDANGIVQFYNAATLNMLDTNANLVGKHLDDILHTFNGKGDPVRFFKSLKSDDSTPRRDDLEHRFGDGESISLGISSSVVRSNSPAAHNKPEGYILIIRDITKSKNLEEERDEFISVVSHELRTPITIAEGTLSNLQLMAEKGASMKTFGGQLRSAHDQIIYLSRMVNDLSTLSRAERGLGDEPEMINVSAFLHDTYNEYEPKARTKGLVLELNAPGSLGYINTSRLYLEEILQNFITNSIKYTEKGTITIAAHKQADKVSISVRDTGIGIGKSDQKHILQKFYRSEDYRTRETSGTGLGLYVVDKLAKRIGAQLTFSSRLNHGSTFTISMTTGKATIDESVPED